MWILSVLLKLQCLNTDADPLCRYIELSNGLRALLISDFSGSDGKGGSENGEDKEGDGEEEEEEEAEEEGDSGEGSEEDEEEDEEEEQDSDFDELDEESAGKKKRGSSEKQVGDVKSVKIIIIIIIISSGVWWWWGFVISPWQHWYLSFSSILFSLSQFTIFFMCVCVDLFLCQITHTEVYLDSVPHTPSCCPKYSPEHQMWINLLLKIVPNKHVFKHETIYLWGVFKQNKLY